MSTPKILAQATPSGVSTEAFYSPTDTTTAIVREFIVCNQSSNAETYSIYVDSAGASYADASALFDLIDIPAHSTDRIQNCYWSITSVDNIGVKVSTASAITFTAFGEEFP